MSTSWYSETNSSAKSIQKVGEQFFLIRAFIFKLSFPSLKNGRKCIEKMFWVLYNLLLYCFNMNQGVNTAYIAAYNIHMILYSSGDMYHPNMHFY